MKKKVISCMLALTLALSMTACGSDDKNVEKGAFEASKQQNDVDVEDLNEDDLNEDDIEEEDFDEEDIEVDSEAVTAERGTFDGNVYTNESMGVQATIPEGFVLYTEEQIQQALGAGAEMMENAEYDSDSIQESLAGTIYDVIAATEDNSANIQIVIEETKRSIGMELDADSYAKLMESNLKTTYQSAGYTIEETDITEESLGGMDFTVVFVNVAGMMQKAYIRQVGNYVMTFTVTYTDASESAVQEFLNSITAI